MIGVSALLCVMLVDGGIPRIDGVVIVVLFTRFPIALFLAANQQGTLGAFSMVTRSVVIPITILTGRPAAASLATQAATFAVAGTARFPAPD